MDIIKKRKKVLDKRIYELDRRKNTLRVDRKIEFLLDIRGYFIVNKIKGSYVEFGCYNGEMLYTALKVLGIKNLCNNFIGLDTFEGEPIFVKGDAKYNIFNVKGDYHAQYEAVEALFKNEPKVKLVKGDFRKLKIQAEFINLLYRDKINVAVVDCNILSSIESSLKLIFKNIQNGAFLFVDDFYTNIANEKIPVRDILVIAGKKFKKELHHYKCYPPFAEAFIVFDK